jgi:hypothetical protein
MRYMMSADIAVLRGSDDVKATGPTAESTDTARRFKPRHLNKGVVQERVLADATM